MSEAYLGQIARKVNNSPYIIPVYLFTIAGMALGLWISANDYYTSYIGIQLIPVRQMRNNPDAIELILRNGYYIAVSLLPQVTIAICFYIMLAIGDNKDFDKGWWLAFFLLIAMLIVDIGTGFLYHYPYSLEEIYFDSVEFWAAIFLSFGVDTVCSEFLVSITFGLYAQIRPHALKAMESMGGMWARWATLGKKTRSTQKKKKERPTTSNPILNRQRPQRQQQPPPPHDYNAFGDNLTHTT